MRVLVTGGGTGGHIYPALSIINKVKELNPNSEFLYIGVEGKMECEIVPRNGIPFKAIKISGINRKKPLKLLKTMYQFISSTYEMKKIIKEFKPDVCVGTGGYVTGPVLYSAHKCDVPTMLIEQDAALGIANKFLSKYVDTIGYVYDSAVSSLQDKNLVKTGNPASEYMVNPRDKSCEIKDLSPNKKHVLVTGGSLGAQVFNDIIYEKSLDKDFDYQIIYVSGKNNYDDIVNRQLNNRNIIVTPYIENMPGLLQYIDLIVGRAGATSIAENLAIGMPSIIVPYPHAGNNEQLKNARQIEEEGACVCIEQKDLTVNSLFGKVESILFDQIKYESMTKNALRLGVRDSATRVYKELEKLVMNRG